METINKPHRFTFCLVMCVRNEAHIIERCLQSVLPLMDSMYICDTGSTDNTGSVIESYAQKHGIPCTVDTSMAWIDYGENKSYLLKRAHEERPDFDYLFWLDADEVYFDTKTKLYCSETTRENLECELMPHHNDANLGACFHLKTHYGGRTYGRWNIVRNRTCFKWEGPVHEILEHLEDDPKYPMHQYTLFSVGLLARAEGDRSLIRDNGNYCKPLEYVKYFRAWFVRRPELEEKRRNHPRWQFYYAQSLEELFHVTCEQEYHNEATSVYRSRIDNPNQGYTEESYLSMLRSGRMTDDVKWFKMAVAKFPTRFEALYELVCRRSIEVTDLRTYMNTYWMPRVSRFTNEPGSYFDEHLFCEQEIVRWFLPFEAALLAHLKGDNASAAIWNMHVMEVPKRCGTYYDQARTNQRFYTEALNNATSANTVTTNPIDSETQTLLASLTTSSASGVSRPPEIVVIDDFLENPIAMRRFAMEQEFSVTGNYPGVRTRSFKTAELKARFEKLVGARITYWPDEYNGAFQWTDGDTRQSWIHRDLTDYAALIYLTPNAPLDSGTTFYRHKWTGLESVPEGDTRNEARLNDDSQRLSEWDVVDVVANKFNRLVMFNGRRSHMSTRYFGKGLETGRLFQTFFFNVERTCVSESNDTV